MMLLLSLKQLLGINETEGLIFLKIDHNQELKFRTTLIKP